MKEREIEPGTPEINKKYSIVVDRKGPYLVYGHPLLKQQFIVQNDEGSSWSYRDGIEYDMNDEPTALCRCGASANKPYCDGAHLRFILIDLAAKRITLKFHRVSPKNL